MSIFENLVPMVALYVPTGKEQETGKCEIVSSEFGFSAKFIVEDKPHYIPVSSKLKVGVGEVYTYSKAVELAQTGYKRDADNKLVVAEPRPDALKVWRVTELGGKVLADAERADLFYNVIKEARQQVLEMMDLIEAETHNPDWTKIQETPIGKVFLKLIHLENSLCW